MNLETRRQLVTMSLSQAALLFVVGFLAMLDRMVAAVVCWGLAVFLGLTAVWLYALVKAEESLTVRRGRG